MENKPKPVPPPLPVSASPQSAENSNTTASPEKVDALYRMTISLNVLNHLGLNLYSNTPAVLSEAVANAYDADATEVNIDVHAPDEIVITDNGHGMTRADVNDKFLHVGYARRTHGESLSANLKRPVMGRKGIGKLSLFSIANEIEVHTSKYNEVSGCQEKSGFILRRKDIQDQLGANGSGEYIPEAVAIEEVSVDHGTKIILRDFKKSIASTAAFLKRRIANRFSVIDEKHNFVVKVDGEPITIQDRDFFAKLQMIWIIGADSAGITTTYKIPKVNQLEGSIDGSGQKVSGWIGAVRFPSDLEIDGISNNKISIIVRGKLAQEDILASFAEGGIYADYLIGEIHADFLDDDLKEDIATSSRQQINEDDDRYRLVQGYVHSVLKKIQSTWSEQRNELALSAAQVDAGRRSPALIEWMHSLKSTEAKKQALQLFATIENFHFPAAEEDMKKKELYKQGVVAFERLMMKDRLHKLDVLKSPDDINLTAIFSDLDDMEANLYYDIASSRVEVIREFSTKLDENQKEKLLQKHLFDHLWLLNPSWERATAGSERMESRVASEFGKVISTLTQEENDGRMDIKYRTSGGKHIIVELKRYKTGYKIDPWVLGAQVDKYKTALHKCLTEIGKGHEPIEVIVVIGDLMGFEIEKYQSVLKEAGGRVIRYDLLIEESMQAYELYLEQHREVGRIRALIDKI